MILLNYNNLYIYYMYILIRIVYINTICMLYYIILRNCSNYNLYVHMYIYYDGGWEDGM